MKAYISCPLDEDEYKIREVGIKLSNLGYPASFYERGTTYSDTKLIGAEMFVLISSDNLFDFTRSSMTAGCKKELELAEALGKKLYLAYWKKHTLHIYSINMRQLSDGRVLGMSGCYLQSYTKPVINNNYSIY